MVNPAVIKSALSAVGAIGSSAVNAGASYAANYRQYQYQRWLQAEAAKLNYDYSIKSALNMSNATRQGLEKAGYNPMLAVQNGTSGANASFTSPGQSSAPDYVGSINSGIANAQSFQRLKNETKQADSQAKMNDATAENQSSQAINNLEENKWIGRKRKAEIANLEGDTMLKEAQIDNMAKQIELGKMGITVAQEANAISAIGKEDYADRAKRYREWGKKHPYLRDIDETITRYFNGVGGNVGANASVSKKFK